MNIYVASPVTEAMIAEMIAFALRSAGHQVTSTWHRDVVSGQDPYAVYGKREALKTNLQDMHRADVMVAWTGSGVGKGTYGEIGRFLAQGKPVVWVQGSEGLGGSIDDADPGVTVVKSAREEDVLRALRGLRSEH